jgi:hypothetical protein
MRTIATGLQQRSFYFFARDDTVQCANALSARDNATASLPSENIVASMPQVIYDKTIMAGGSIFSTHR